jgi:1,4-alpha-glucan branching enzyme
MGWMNDSLQYMHEDPVHRRWHHNKMTFSLVYAFSENFVLPLSHDEVVHGKGSLFAKMPGDDWQKFANLRAYYGFMWGHPGKKLVFMGQEFAQAHEWHHDQELPWSLLDDVRHAGIQALIRDLNALYKQHSALHQLDCEPTGFEWLSNDDAEQSSLAWLRKDTGNGRVIVISNFTPVPRNNYRIGIPENLASHWREALNTDSHHYGGSDMGNGAGILGTEDIPAHGHRRSIALTLPPLSTVFLVPA